MYKKLFFVFLSFVSFQVSAQMNKFFSVQNYTLIDRSNVYNIVGGSILHLDAGNTSSYVGSGTSWNDVSGTGNNAPK